MIRHRQEQIDALYRETFGSLPATPPCPEGNGTQDPGAVFREAARMTEYDALPAEVRAGLEERLARCASPPDSDRSDADRHLCCWGIEHGVGREIVWQRIKDVGKCQERGRGYFDETWEKAETHVHATGAAINGNGTPASPAGSAAQAKAPPNAYQICLAFFSALYGDASFRRGNAIFSANLSREVKAAEACFAPPDALVHRLLNATDCPPDGDDKTKGKRSAVPRLFKLWAGSAWTDFVAGLSEEEEAAEVNDAAREQFRAQVKAALYEIVVLGRHVKVALGGMDGVIREGYETRQERRSFKDYCRLWAKERWEQGKVRSYEIWARKELDGTLRVAIRQELFQQINKELAGMPSGKFKRLCERYGVGRETFVLRRRVIELTQEFLADHLADDCERPDEGTRPTTTLGEGMGGEGI